MALEEGIGTEREFTFTNPTLRPKWKLESLNLYVCLMYSSTLQSGQVHFQYEGCWFDFLLIF